jgi:flavin-dependent dehydrogenase
MDHCDVLIVGGGPAGSTCARRLVQAGVSVVVMDRAAFPRDKVCAGWITPAVVQALDLDLDDYARRLTLQPFTGFQTASFDGPLRLTDFDRTISYGIRRCEFDHYLLNRSGARLRTGEPLQNLRREGHAWVANATLRADLVVGAGGHFCPVARHLNPHTGTEHVIVAQEIEFRMDDEAAEDCRVDGRRPALFFWPDLLGYGWCVRKGRFLNVGVGRLTQGDFPARVREFAARLAARKLVPGGIPSPWKGHAYLVNRTSSRRIVGEGMLLVGDAAGLALAPSGEGILAAVESGLMAADAILGASTGVSASLAAYEDRIEARFGPRGASGWFGHVPGWVAAAAGRALLGSPWLTRRVLIEDSFLHVRRRTVQTSPHQSVEPVSSRL